MNKVLRLCLFCCNSEDKNKEDDMAKAKPELSFEKQKKNPEQLPDLPLIKQSNDERPRVRDSSESCSISSGS